MTIVGNELKGGDEKSELSCQEFGLEMVTEESKLLTSDREVPLG